MMGKVYFIECAGRIKIGFTADVKSRIKGLSTGSAHDLTVIAAIDGSVHLERAIHRILKAHRQRGEWFDDCPAVRGMISDLQLRGIESIGFVEPPPKVRFIPKAINRDTSHHPLAPVYRRVESCMERYIGDRIAEAREREQSFGLEAGALINRIIGGYYTVSRQAFAIHMARHTMDCMDELLDDFRETIFSECPIDMEDTVPRATYLVERLERGLQRLFESRDLTKDDVSGYDGMSLRQEPPQAPAATEFCYL